MNCPNCGEKINEHDNFCTACGKNLTNSQETVIYSFGPWGTGICLSKPSFLTMIQKNITKIELTDQRISGYSTPTKPRFEIPYNSIIGMEPFDYMLWKVLWLRYQDAQKVAEISIMGTATNHQHIINIQNIIETHRKSKTQ
jgi:zinc-ribbon domain